MFLVIRAWRSSRMIRFLVLTAVLGTATQLIHSRGAGAVENKAARQTRIIGSDRLVSVERLPEMGGEICLPESAAQPALSASLMPAGGEFLKSRGDGSLIKAATMLLPPV
jgi:hypothetical protein